MATLLLKHADLLVTMDADRRRIPDGGLYAEDGVIRQVGPTGDLPAQADQVLDARGMVVIPGMVNIHHHLYQTLTRALPEVEAAGLFAWLQNLYRVWAELTPEAVYVSAKAGLAELLRSGCTTTTDHLYLFPNGARLDDEIRAAQELGIRFHPCRGSMSLGRSQGGLPPDEVVEDEEAILLDCERVVNAFHDPRPYAMCRIAIAPCSPFSVTPELMREAAAWARARGLLLHTHVAETLDEERFCLERFGMRPVAYMERLGWVGPDVWYAHAVHLNDEEVRLMAETGTGVAHCPTSNMRLGSGIAPVVAMREAGVRVGLAVDGSASNDSSHMLAEARQALLLQRVQHGAEALRAEDALEMATVGGARVLGRDDLGALAPGMAADFVGFRLDVLDYAGAHDPLAALLLCQPQQAALVVVNGQVRVWDGEIVGLDLAALVARHNAIAQEMVARARSRH
ncbi:MAG: 8-oxoguanine deaminase [Anaerolineae bacterium]|nr:8-oxoguanine deaminase [Anaerolineae bacterium]